MSAVPIESGHAETGAAEHGKPITHSPNPNAGAEHAEGEHAEPEHAAKHKHGGHGAGGHGAAGHGGGSWLTTYCDMITLLIAFFICILTFSSKENGSQRFPKMRDSILYGAGGAGPVGEPGSERDSIVWREVLASTNLLPRGSLTQPSHADPALAMNEKVLDMLEAEKTPSLNQGYSFRIPLVMIVNDANALSPAGERLFNNLAYALKQFSHDLAIRVDDPANYSLAFQCARHLSALADCPMSRIAIGIDENAPSANSIQFVFLATRR